MIKDFEVWNKQKKKIHEYEGHKLYHEREVWWCSLGINVGFEQDGTGKDGERPVLILKGFSAKVCLIVPLTTSMKNNPYHIDLGLLQGRRSFAIISQIRLIDTRRLVNKMCFIDKVLFQNIRKTIKDLL